MCIRDRRRDRAILFTFIDSGIRLGELLSLTAGSFRAQDRTFEVTGKTGTRRLNFGKQPWIAVDRYLRSRRSHAYVDREELWLGNQGPLTQSGIAQMLKRRSRQAGVEGVNPHRFRHTVAHNWLKDGGNETDLQRHMGWSSLQMAAVYAESTAEERAIEAHARLSLGDKFA